MKPHDMERLLNREEVCKRFGIPKRFLELADARGEGPVTVRFGRLVRYRTKDIEDWIDSLADGDPSGIRSGTKS